MRSLQGGFLTKRDFFQFGIAQDRHAEEGIKGGREREREKEEREREKA